MGKTLLINKSLRNLLIAATNNSTLVWLSVFTANKLCNNYGHLMSLQCLYLLYFVNLKCGTSKKPARFKEFPNMFCIVG